MATRDFLYDPKDRLMHRMVRLTTGEIAKTGDVGSSPVVRCGTLRPMIAVTDEMAAMALPLCRGCGGQGRPTLERVPREPRSDPTLDLDWSDASKEG